MSVQIQVPVCGYGFQQATRSGDSFDVHLLYMYIYMYIYINICIYMHMNMYIYVYIVNLFE
jgi:hypothetical protein